MPTYATKATKTVTDDVCKFLIYGDQQRLMRTNAFETELKGSQSSVEFDFYIKVTHDPLPSMKTPNPLRRKFNIRGKRKRNVKNTRPSIFSMP